MKFQRSPCVRFRDDWMKRDKGLVTKINFNGWGPFLRQIKTIENISGSTAKKNEKYLLQIFSYNRTEILKKVIFMFFLNGEFHVIESCL